MEENFGRKAMIMNWIRNSQMQELIKRIEGSSDTEKLMISVEQLERLFNPPFKKVKDCIIIAEKSSQFLDKHFNKAMEMYMDKTAYEASNNETRINCFFKNEISMETGTRIALTVLENWALKLKSMDNHSNFCLIMSCDEECVEIRFHKVRREEVSWLAEDIESYTDGAVGYTIV